VARFALGARRSAYLHLRRTCLAESLHGQPQDVPLRFRFHHAAYHVALRRPKVQQASAVIARNRVFRVSEIEYGRTVFQDDSVP
jgi:hypothetical protein